MNQFRRTVFYKTLDLPCLIIGPCEDWVQSVHFNSERRKK
jgi:hypothetical protein